MLSSWIVPIASTEKCSLRLFCLPYAGGGASVFRKWKEFLAPNIELFAIQLPGRESRYSEPPIQDLSLLIQEIANSIMNFGHCPFAIYGHSLGGSLAFELTLELERKGFYPEYLFISGRQSPGHISLRSPIGHLPDDQFLNELAQYKSTPPEILQNHEFIKILLPMLKADFSIAEKCTHEPNKKVLADLIAIGSYKDIWLLPTSLEGWGDYTTGKFSTQWFDGGHLFLNENTQSLVDFIMSKLQLSTQSPCNKKP